MNRTLLLLTALLLLTFAPAQAENWDYVRQHPELYYHGIGHGNTEEDAKQKALESLTQSIAVHVKSSFDGLIDETHRGSDIEHREKVLSCVRTYSHATLRNVKYLTENDKNGIAVMAYMFCSEMEQVYRERTDLARQMAMRADEALEGLRIGMALQYYYHAYSLVRSLPIPSEAKDDKGNQLVVDLPYRIQQVLADVNVTLDQRDGDFVDLLFSYKGKPVSSLEFTYNDGRNAGIPSTAKDGRGTMEMIPGCTTDYYKLQIEYEYRDQARGDELLQSVMEVIPRKRFDEANRTVAARSAKTVAKPKQDDTKKDLTGIILKPTKTQTAADTAAVVAVMATLTEAIRTRQYSKATSAFTLEGLDRWNKLISYGTGRIVGTPRLQFFKGLDGHTVARGLQMAFTFKQGTKKSFVEDVIFTFNREGKIDNVTFGLGQVAENDILCKHPRWKEETRELLMEFLENYKTAYCLKDMEYIRNVFADDAVIIVGSVARRSTASQPGRERPVSLEGQEVIHYNRYDKDGYLKRLAATFRQNEMINLRFSNNDIQPLLKYKDEEIFGITIGQEYNSTRYADKGYLYLLVNMTDHQNPQIKIRTWQPNEVDMSKVFNSGYFYE